jgi:hypothetical protein
MKTCKFLSESGPAAVVLLAGVLVLATGCVHERVVNVTPAYPVVVQEPGPVPPPPVVTPVPPPPPPVPMRSAADLDRMLAPVALYPDPLLAQLLPAATMPEQVVLADRYLREGGNLNLVDAQPWDNSLKALARYPAILRMLDENLAWTTDLGQAFLNQPADVMDSVQRLRAQARDVGNLQSTPQQTVVVSGGIIEIVPTSPQVIYVPVYQPEVVYVHPPPGPGRLYISFGAGLVVGPWLNHDCDWHRHEVLVWHHDHPRPAGWWYRAPAQRQAPVNNVTVVNNTTIVNQNVTVWHPQDRGVVAERTHRGSGQPPVRATTVAPARNEPAKPRPGEVHETTVVVDAPKAVSPKEVHPAPVPVKEPRLNQPGVQRPPVRPQEARGTPARQDPRPITVAPSTAAHAASPRQETQPASVLPREPSAEKTTVAKPPAPATAQASNGQRPLGRELPSAQRPGRAVPAPKDAGSVAAPATPKQPSITSGRQQPAVPSVTSHAPAPATARTPSAAPTATESTRVTHDEVSARGRQSGQTMGMPAAAPKPASATVPSPKAKSTEVHRAQQTREN